MSKPFCCYLYFGKFGCPSPPKWVTWPNSDYYMQSHACNRHLGKIITDIEPSTVQPMGMELAHTLSAKIPWGKKALSIVKNKEPKT